MVEILLGVATALTLAVICLWGLTQLRDELVAHGWVRRSSWLGRMSTQAAISRAAPVLDSLGVNEDEGTAFRRTRDARRVAATTSHITRPDQALLHRLHHWTKMLDAPYQFRGSAYYIDTMGAAHHRQPHEPSLSQIMGRWLGILQENGVVDDYDAVLTPKEGNPLLAYELCASVQNGRKVAILCKGTDDPARVSGPTAGPHPMDFEGLEAVLARAREQLSTPPRPLTVIAVDDSCTSGSTICNAVARFNELVRSTPEIAKLVSPISQVVVLFRVLAPGEKAGPTDSFTTTALRLHALVSLNPDQMKDLIETRPGRLDTLASKVKTDPFACATSVRILAK